MTKWLKPIAFALMMSGLLLAGLYGWDMIRSAGEAERMRQLHARGLEYAGSDVAGSSGESRPQSPSGLGASAPEPAVDFQTESPNAPSASANRPVPDNSRPIDPFTGLRNPLPSAGRNPLADLYAINSDLIGWIRIADTRIDYPIVKSRDNTFYLTHSFERKKSAAGAIFMDYRNIGDGLDAHTIIYGHKMKSGSMFQNLVKFESAPFYERHRTIMVDTLYGSMTYRVFAAYTTGTDFEYIQTSLDQAAHAAFLAEIRKRSVHAWDTDVTFNDRILTLSTCSSDFRDARFVVHAKRIG